MRPVAALLLGGLISCCGSGGTASAQAAGSSQAVELPADSVSLTKIRIDSSRVAPPE